MNNQGTYIMNEHFVKLIKGLNKPTLAKIITRTEVKMNKKDIDTKSKQNPYSGAVKVTTQIVELNPQYEQAVNEQLKQEEKPQDFEASSRKWGQNIGNGLVENNGKLYVSFIPKEHILNTYMFGNTIIDKSELDPFIPKKKDINSQGTETSVLFRTISIENICTIELI